MSRRFCPAAAFAGVTRARRSWQVGGATEDRRCATRCLCSTKSRFPPIRRGRLDTLQINVGYRCNQSCFHCHVNAGPNRTEEMTGDVADLVLDFVKRRRIATLDITGGAPELNAHFRRLVTRRARARRQGDGPLQSHHPGAAGPGRPRRISCARTRSRWSPRCRAIWKTMSSASAARACSTPRSAACSKLNALGYGRDPALVLNLVYNPQGPVAAAGASRARSRLQARAGRAIRHRVQQALRARQHADPALRLRAGHQGRVRRLSRPAAATRISTPISTASCAAT